VRELEVKRSIGAPRTKSDPHPTLSRKRERGSSVRRWRWFQLDVGGSLPVELIRLDVE